MGTATTGGWRRTLALGACVALAMAGCTGGDDDDSAEGTSTTVDASTTTTARVDFSKVELPPVEGSTTTTLALGPGRAALEGVAVAPSGAAAAGAIVRIERLVGDAVAVADVPVGLDGRWSLSDVLGGRYRVRAWLAPDLAMVEPTIFFLEHDERKQLDLRLEEFSGTVAVAATNPDPPFVDEPAVLAVRVVSRVVDEQGIVRSTPQPGVQVQLAGSGQWIVTSSNPTTTDSTGTANWSVECLETGAQPLSVLLGASDVLPLDVPACVSAEPPESTTTTSSPSGSTTSTTATTSTTSTSTSTTSTTERGRGNDGNG
jgi:hypothetical protein